MSSVLNHLRKTALIFGLDPDKSKVQQQIEELQGQTPRLSATGGADGGTSIISTLLKDKNKKQEAVLSNEGSAGYEYRGEHPTTKSDGLDSAYSMSDLGSSVNKISTDKTAEPVGKNVSMYTVKGSTTQPKARGTKVLLRTPASVKLSAFMGGVLSGFSKSGSRPDVDPGMLFDEIVRHLPSEATPEEKTEVRTAFIENW